MGISEPALEGATARYQQAIAANPAELNHWHLGSTWLICDNEAESSLVYGFG